MIVFAACAALSVLAFQRMLTSLANLTEAVRNISNGGRDMELEIGGDAQVEELAEALSVMAMDRFRAEDALMISEERFRQLFQCAPDAILVEDSLGTILDANTAACQLYGLAKEELVGQNMISLLPISVRGRAARNFRHWFSDNPTHQESVCYNCDGAEIPVEINGAPIVYGGQRCVILTLRDISLRKEVERTLDDARQKADRLTRLQTVFLSNISHEIRTPMNAIIGLSGLLKATKLNAEQAEYAETISDSCDHLLGVLTNLVDLAKLESGYIEIEPEPFDLQEMFFDLSATYKERAERKGLTFYADISSDLPETFIGDGKRVGQVLRHLLDNALKFTHEGKVVFAVAPAAAGVGAEGQYVVHFSIRDTGIGMTSDLQRMVFSMFSQADGSSTRQYGGMGIGLALCRKIVEKMGGILKLTSRQDQGSTFSCVLPLELVPAPVELSREQ